MRRLLPCLLYALLGVGSAILAFGPPGHGELPNYDRRLEAGQGGGAVSPEQEAAAAKLRAAVPGVVIRLDPISGAPRVLGVPGGLLTRAVGAGGGGGVGGVGGGGDPDGVVKGFIREHAPLLGHGPEALAGARMRREFVTAHNGMRTVAWQQRKGGLDVFGAVLISHLSARGELVNLSSCFMPDAVMAEEAGQGGGDPDPDVRLAVVKAAEAIGVELALDQISLVPAVAGEEDSKRRCLGPGLQGEVVSRLVWLPISRGAMRLCWEVVLCRREGGETFRVLVEAGDGTVWLRHCLTEYITPASFRVFTSDSPSPFSPGLSVPGSGQPGRVEREWVVLSALDTNASPLGWIPDGGNETVGNNVHAHLDRNADNLPDLPRPAGFPARVFDPSFDPALAPSTYGNAAVVQLFYLNNWIHDRLYQLGFTETAGNFQTSNLGRGGLGGDAVQADAQDGSGVNNANFTTFDEGIAPRMQMYTWDGPNPDRDGDLDAEIVIHEYAHGLSNRRVGAGTGLVQLQSRGMGEGWSDFYALALLSEAGDDVDGVYAMGAYSTMNLRGLAENYYFGIRRYPYSTDLQKNPLTFKDIDPGQASSHSTVPRSPVVGTVADQVHNIGTVWCAVLWDVRAELIREHGFDPGNELVLRLVTDGMNLAPSNPNFLEARDAILQADLVNNGGANQDRLWAAFARRGMGMSAGSPGSFTTAGVVEAYDIPDDLKLIPEKGITFAGSPGGPFGPGAQVYGVRNDGAGPLDWSVAAAAAADWLVVSNAGGVLAAGESGLFTVGPGPAANGLGVGEYPGQVCVTNRTSGAVRCLGFQLRVGVDAFVELFEDDDLDVANQSFTFTPDGSPAFYNVCREPVTAFPTDPAGGTVLALGDDTFAAVALSGGAKVALYGVATDVVYVGSNGYITFGTGDTQFIETLSAHLAIRRVAALFQDLNPAAGGSISWRRLADRLAVTYLDVPEFGTVAANRFQIELFFDGRIRISYLALGAREGIIGLSAGVGMPPGFGERDFSLYSGCGSPVGRTLVVSVQPGSTRRDFSGWVGMRMTVGAEAMTVSGLGRYVAPGNSGVHRLKLVRTDTGQDVPGTLTTVSLAGRAPGRFVYGLLPLSVSLTPGASYYLVSEEVVNQDYWYDLNTAVNLTPAAVCNGPVFGGNGSWSGSTSPGLTYVGMDLLYTTVPPGPEVALTSPAEGAFFVEPADIPLVASAMVPGGAVNRVEFYEGANRLGESLAPPYQLSWGGVLPGQYALTAVLIDHLGMAVTSAVVNVTVRVNVPGTRFVRTVVPGTLRNNFAGWVGMQFTVGSEPLRLLELGRMFVPGNSGNRTVKLVHAGTGNDVAGGSVTVALDGGVPNQFVYGLLPGPLTLQPGTSYGLVSLETINGNLWYDLNTELTTEPTATCDGAVWIGGGGYNLFLVDDHAYVPVDFKSESAPAPPGVPVVELVSPGDGARFVAPADLRLEAVADGNGGVVSSVRFYEGGTLIGEALSEPFRHDWNGVGIGVYEVTARITDSRGMSATSAVVRVTVTEASVGTGLVVSQVPGSVRNNFSGWVGMKIRVGAEPLTVTELGRFVTPGNTREHLVKLVNSVSGQDLPGGGVVVNTTGPVENGYAFGSLPAPVLLQANGEYHLVSQETLGGDRWHDSDTDVVTTPAAICLGPVWSNGGGWNAVATANHSYVPLNLKYETTPAALHVRIISPADGATYPDPSDIVIEAMAGGGAGVVTEVEFRAGAMVLGAVSAPPYRLTWPGVLAGDYELTAVVTDDRGESVMSEVVNVSVTTVVPGAGWVLSKTGGPLRNDFGGWVGMRMTVGVEPLRVTELGRSVSAGNSASHVVKLVNAVTGLDVVGGAVTVPTAGVGVGQFSYGLLPAGLTLPAGGSYYLVSQETVNGDRWQDLDTEVTTANVAACDGPVWGGNGSWNFILRAGRAYVPLDVKYATEPGPPSVRITAPADGSRVVAPADVAVEVSASGNGAAVTKVEFFEGGTYLGEDLAAPYLHEWTGVEAGEYLLTARAHDAAGRVSTSAVVRLTVSTNLAGVPLVAGSVVGRLRNDFPGWVGMRITIGGTPLTVVALGRRAAAAGGGNHRVRLVDASTGGTLGETVVNVGSVNAGEVAYAPLDPAVVLAAGRSVYLVSEEFLGGDRWHDLDTRITTSGLAICDGPVWGGPGAWNPILNPGRGYVPVDLQHAPIPGLEQVVTPEPRVSATRRDDGGLIVRIVGEAEWQGVLEASEDLVEWSAWIPVRLSPAGEAAIPVEIGGSRRFFRVRSW